MSASRWIKRLRNSLREYFSFTESELRGTLALVVIIVMLLALRWSLPFFHTGKLNRLNAVNIEDPDSLIAVTDRLFEKNDSVREAKRSPSMLDMEIERSV